MDFIDASYLVENSIIGLKVDPVACRGDKPGKWTLRIKDSEVWVDVYNFETNPGRYYLQVMSPIFKLGDVNKADIQNDLLEYAYSMYGCSVCQRENWCFVMVLRETLGLSQSEVDAAIDRVGHYSSDIYGKFKFKYPAAIK
jgi:hypothetical protein